MQRKIQIDSVEYEADEAVIGAYKKAQQDVAEKQKALDTVTAERDAAKALCDKKDKEIEALKASQKDEAEIAKRVDARLALLKVADEKGVEKASEMDDKSIKAAVIGKAFEGVSLDGKSDDYVQAMFDAACASKSKTADNSIDAHKGVQGDSKDYSSDESVNSARDAFLKRMRGEGEK